MVEGLAEGEVARLRMAAGMKRKRAHARRGRRMGRTRRALARGDWLVANVKGDGQGWASIAGH